MDSALKWGLVLGGGYLLWSYYQSAATPAAAAAPASGSSAPPASTTPTSTTPAAAVSPLIAQLETVAATDPNYHGTYNPDQWSYVYQNLPGKAVITPATFTAMNLFPNGRPADPSQYPQITSAQFVAALATQGLSGYGPRPILVPRAMFYRGRG